MFSIYNSTYPWDTSEQSNANSSRASVENNESEISLHADSTSTSTTSNGNSTRDGTPPIVDISGEARQLSLDQDSLLDIANGAASTPRVARVQRNRRSNDTSQPIDLVDLSNFDVGLSSRLRHARIIAPSAVIDLCTPPHVAGYINLAEPQNQSSGAGRRARRRINVPEIDLIDTTTADGPSPPKHSCGHNISSEDVYKCPVCLECVRQHEPCATRCGHIFCKSCIESAVQSTRKCPLCNKKLTLRQLLRIYF